MTASRSDFAEMDGQDPGSQTSALPAGDGASDGVVGDLSRPERLRLTGFLAKRSPSGQCMTEVTLEWIEGQQFIGRAEGVSSPYGDLRLAADATLRALQAFARRETLFEVSGVKALRVFDSNVVIVAILCRRGGKEQRLLGCHLTEEDAMRSAVLATLQATNRILGIISRNA